MNIDPIDFNIVKNNNKSDYKDKALSFLNLFIAVDVPNAIKTSKSRVRAIEMLFFGWILNAVHVNVTLESMDLLFHTFQH